MAAGREPTPMTRMADNSRLRSARHGRSASTPLPTKTCHYLNLLTPTPALVYPMSTTYPSASATASPTSAASMPPSPPDVFVSGYDLSRRHLHRSPQHTHLTIITRSHIKGGDTNAFFLRRSTLYALMSTTDSTQTCPLTLRCSLIPSCSSRPRRTGRKRTRNW